MKTITFIGAGKMAEAIIQGILAQKFFKSKDITVTDISAERLEELSAKYQIRTNINNIQAISQAEIVCLAIKPQAMDSVLKELQAVIKPEQLIISIAAGVTINKIDQDNKLKVVRVMPNTPAIVGQAASAIAFNENVSVQEKEFVLKLFQAIGSVVETPEAMLNAVTGLSGSGPAFVFRLMEAFILAGTKLGLSEQISRELTFQTFRGSAELALKSEKSLPELIEQVTSPNGTTAAGRKVLENSAVQDVLVQTIIQAKTRADELSKG